MKCDFQVGDEVVCVDNTNPSEIIRQQCFLPPEIGKVYHVASINPTPVAGRLLGEGWSLGLTLSEMTAWCACDDKPIRYPHGWFRKVEKLKKDDGLEVFRKIVREVGEQNSVPEPVDA